MASIGGSQTDAFGEGTSPVANPNRVNLSTISPVTSLAPSSGLDSAFEDLERDRGSYTPGTMPVLQDQLSAGSDDES